nr:adenosylcobinamide-GDP ribazoletransferase [Dissulfurirhabdus thermomarina]
MTVVSIAPRLEAGAADLRRSLAFFPAVGLLLGGLLAGFDWAARGLWPSPVVGAMEAAWLALLTRGLHMDGLADTADGLASGFDAARSLEVMRDSRSGALGVLAVVLVLLLKATGLAALSAGGAATGFFCLVPCLARWGINVLGALSPYARPGEGLGRAFTGAGAARALPAAGLTALGAAYLLGGAAGLAAFAGVTVLSAAAAAWFRHRLGGVTGDVLGAHAEVTEVVLVLLFCRLSGG